VSAGDRASAGGLRVALLSPCYWPEVRRGGERFTRELADGLIAAGHRPRLITSHPGPPRRRVEDGLPVLRLPRPPQGRLLRRGFEPYLTHVPLSYAALRAGRFDLAHAVYPTDALAAARWRSVTGRPAILSYLGIPDRAGLRWRRGRLEVLQAALKGCDAVTALSEYAAAAFRDWLGYEARVIPPGVDLRAFQPAAARAPRPTILCSADATEPRKHVGLLAAAFALVRSEHPDAELVLSAPADPRGLRAAGSPADAPGIRWRNLDDRGELARACGTAWVVALPSSAEAFGLVLAEALACGTPVVGYADGAIPELITDPATGRLFHELSAPDLARALLETLELAGRPETAGRCRERVRAFSTERCTAAYLDLYAELLAR
jgi:glycosyltransferase involved in cell wall biosynthesis